MLVHLYAVFQFVLASGIRTRKTEVRRENKQVKKFPSHAATTHPSSATFPWSEHEEADTRKTGLETNDDKGECSSFSMTSLPDLS